MIFFRFPFSAQILTVEIASAENVVSFVSFDGKEQLDFFGKIKEISPEELQNNTISSDEISQVLYEFSPELEDDYVDKITDVKNFVTKEKLEKIVISRRKLVNYGKRKIDLNKTFLNLCEKYSNAFVYLFIRDGSCWMGAFSEVLGKFQKGTGQFETMSLAGTLQLAENWTEKEIQEQQPVTDFIESTLKNYSQNVKKSAITDHISGNIKHLRTDFTATVQSNDVQSIIAELHPTPAVCGIPKDVCKSAILGFEKYLRNYYAGYIKVETAAEISYFVNLRCAEFLKNAAIIYVGGGITAKSSPQKEWQETELKAQAILKNLAWMP